MIHQYVTQRGTVLATKDHETGRGIMMLKTDNGIAREQPTEFKVGDKIYFHRLYSLGEDSEFDTIVDVMEPLPVTKYERAEA